MRERQCSLSPCFSLNLVPSAPIHWPPALCSSGGCELRLDTWFKKTYKRKVTDSRYWDPLAPDSGFYNPSEDKALEAKHGKLVQKHDQMAFDSLKDASESLLAGGTRGALAAAVPGTAEAQAAKFWVRLSKTEKSDASNQGEPKYCGHLLVSLQLVPEAMVEQVPAGTGRAEPNANPFLPSPTGRLTFTLNPFKMLYRVLGPKLCGKLSGLMLALGFLAILYYMLPVLAGNAVTGVVQKTVLQVPQMGNIASVVTIVLFLWMLWGCSVFKEAIDLARWMLARTGMCNGKSC